MRGHFTPHSEETKQKMRDAKLRNPVRYWKGKKLPESFRKAQLEMIKKNKGEKHWNFGKHWKNEKEFKEKCRKRMTGKNNHNWRGGISNDGRHYYTAEYKEWRLKIFTRDGFKCQSCGQVGTYLQAHHIKSYAHYPEFRFYLDNGVTLCIECHKKTDNYKGRGIKKKQGE